MPLLTLLVCFIKFMDQNTLILLPLIPSLSLLPLYGQIPAAASHPRAMGVLVIAVSNSPAIETLLALKNGIQTST